MSDLLVLVSTLGGIVAFGATGFIIGPIVAALWVTVWEIYGEMFSEYLPLVEMPVTDTVAGIPVVVAPGADSRPRKRQPADMSLPWAEAENEAPGDSDDGSAERDS